MHLAENSKKKVIIHKYQDLAHKNLHLEMFKIEMNK